MSAGAVPESAATWLERGRTCLQGGDLDGAQAALHHAAELAHGEGDGETRGAALNQLAAAAHQRGETAAALTLLREALEHHRAQGNTAGAVQVLTNTGAILMWLGQYGEALRPLGEAYALFRTLDGHAGLLPPILHNLAHVHAQSGDLAQATGLTRAALEAALTSGHARQEASAQLNLGSFLLEQGDCGAARPALLRANALARDLADHAVELASLDSLGTLYARTGEPWAARGAFERSVSLAVQAGARPGEVQARLGLGRLLLDQGEVAAARAHLELGLRAAQDAGLPREQAALHEVLSEVCEREGRVPDALTHARMVTALTRELFDAERDRRTRHLAVQFEVERAQHDAHLAHLRTELEHEGREQAERTVQERTADLVRAQHEVVTRLAMAAEYRDDQTGEHTRRVGHLAARLARALGQPDERAAMLGVAARLHDVGKIGIPDAVLLKPGRLTAEEIGTMRQHTVIGARILSGGRSALLRLAEEVALTHHERWDGAGYPAGLAGEAIPLSGRIVAVADVYGALTTARPYKDAWTPEAALDELERGAGGHFDPAVVACARTVLVDVGAGVDDPAGPEPLLPQDDASAVLHVFEQVLVERTRELEHARAEAERLAHTDLLTGLGNRRAFEAALAAWAAARTPGCMVVLDADGLKLINDTRGHASGDAYLKVAGHVLATVHPGQAYRIGGDEFALVGVEMEPARLRAALDTALDAAGFGTSLSLGVAGWEDGETPAALLRAADARMYADKATRRLGRPDTHVGGDTDRHPGRL